VNDPRFFYRRGGHDKGPTEEMRSRAHLEGTKLAHQSASIGTLYDALESVRSMHWQCEKLLCDGFVDEGASGFRVE